MARTRGIMVELLDHDKLAEACEKHHIGAPNYMENGLLRRLDGGAAVVVSSEGVSASKITMGQVYLDTNDSQWQCLPLEVVEACRTGESKDLADLIRTFGQRLENNHYQWCKWAEQVTV